MKKEGTGKPRSPDNALDAAVRARELCFEDAPDPEVRFRGSTRRNSVWGSRRENLPDRVREGVVYRDAEVRLRIASEITGGDPTIQSESGKERVKTKLEDSGRKTGEQGPKNMEEKK